MGLANCSTSLVSIRTVNAQLDGAVTGVEGDCQYVLFNVTVPPQVVIASIRQDRQDISYFHSHTKNRKRFCYLLMQQTFPRMQEPLGLPPNNEQMFPGAQIPASPLGDVHASKVARGLSKLGFTVIGILLAKLAKGLHVLAGVNRLLNRPVLIKLARKPPTRRPSEFSSSSFSVLI
jgi:hypothetical protein